ncbi:MAG: AraC family transcriptional regulator [Caldimonas sp.]
MRRLEPMPRILAIQSGRRSLRERQSACLARQMDGVTAPLPRNLLDSISEAGVDLVALTATLGLRVEQLENGLGRIDVDRFLCAAWSAVDDPAFGLRAGSVVRPERFGVSGLAAMSSPTFLEALRRKGRYNRLIWGDAFDVEERGDQVIVTMITEDESRPYGAAKIDMELAALLAFGRRFTGAQIAPLSLALRQRKPAYSERYLAVFGVVPHFGEETNALAFTRVDADLPLISANSLVNGGIVGVAESALMKLDLPRTVTQVRAELGKAMHGEEPALRDIARRLCVSERTLQRRLSSEGASFSGLVDDLRREVAQHRLRGGHANVGELAFLLGFADTNSFYRAFRRWTGTTPEMFKRGVTSLA